MAVRYGMVIDTKRCIACNTCTVGCKVENNLPANMWWNVVVNVGGANPDSPTGVYPNLTPMWTYTLACQHCDNPACVAVCPTGATFKREDGIVMVDPEVCIGCKLCVEACPYPDVRRYQDGEPVSYTDFDMGGEGALVHVANTVEKCTFCAHRVDRGEKPFCVEVCPGRARYFGDLNDPESDVVKAMEGREVEQLQVEDGTGPAVYLLK